MNDVVMRADDLQAFYQTNLFGVKREVRVIDGISLSVKRNEIYGIAGESGCGKTTLLKLLSGSVRPPLRVLNGRIVYDFNRGGTLDLLGAPEEALADARWKSISYIMQGSMNVLNPLRRIHKSFIDFASAHMTYETRKDFRRQVVAHLAKLRLPAEVLNAYPHELSGGMRQRVTIALATICEPEVIIADEPTTALDVVVQRETLNLIKQVQVTSGNTVILVTHDLAVHANLADRLAIMYAGRIVEESTTEKIFNSARHPYTRHLVQSLPRIGDRTQRVGLEGTPPNLASPPEGCRFHPRCPHVFDRCRSESPPILKQADGHRVACFLETDAKEGGDA
jgi:peptide/nickel transport system ATP-binding protein